MTKTEHDEMVRCQAIVCHGPDGIDAICAEYPKLVTVVSGEEKTLDVGGDMVALLGEKQAAERNGKTARIEYFPRAFTEYMARKNSLRIDSFQGRVLIS